MPNTLDHDFFQKNLAVIEKISPYLHYKLSQITETHSELTFNENGSPDIIFRGQKLYNCDDLTNHLETQIETYLKNRRRIFLDPPQSENLDDASADFTFNVVQRSIKEGVTFATDMIGNDTFTMISFGLGLGRHILPLSKKTNVMGLTIIEPNIEFFYHSLFVTDWEKIFEHFDGFPSGRYLNLLCHPEAQNTLTDFVCFMRGINASFCDGIDFFTHYPSSVMEEMKKLIVKEANLIVMGLGFYIDEEVMVRNSYLNLRNYSSHIFKTSDRKLNLPIFIIGSGPSLAHCLDYIKDNQENVIIVSGGTALQPLLRAGITPDFQVEVENVEASIGVLQKARDEFDLSSITIVTTTTMQPDAIACFDQKVLYFRQSLTSNPMFSLGKEYQLLEVSPTVTNAALSFAQQIGGREFYFFGMDYGARQADKMHIEGSVYSEGLDFKRRFTMPHRGNFGGTIYTDSILNWARNIAERSIQRFQFGHTYYNCSDGALIEHAIPKLPRALKPQPVKDKAAAVKEIKQNFELYSHDHFERTWGRTDWKQQAHDLCDAIIAVIDSDQEDNYWARYIERIARLVILSDEDTTPAQFMFRGSIFMMFMGAVFYPTRVVQEELRPLVRKIVREELRNSVLNLQKRADEFYDKLAKE
jgi:hypothetical protein